MSRRSDLVALQQIRDYTQEVQALSAGKSAEDFRGDRLLNLALVRLLEIIGEAATRVSPETRDRYSQIPWSQIISLRNRLIHGYDSVDLAIVWTIITDDVPNLVSHVEAMLHSLEQDAGE